MPAVTTTGKINPDLAREREKCTFDVEELATYWIGDKQKLEEKRARGKCQNSLFGIFWCSPSSTKREIK